MNKLILVLLAVILLITPASAMTLEKYDATITLDQNIAKEELYFVVKNTGETSITLNLPPDIRNLEIKVNDLKTNCQQKIIAGATQITCPISFKSDYYVTAEFETNYVIIDLGKKNLFKQTIFGDLNLTNVSLRVKLPEGGMIEQPITQYVTPEPTNIYSDGRRIILLFEMQNLSKDPGISIIYTEPQKTINIAVIAIIILLLASVSGFAYYWLILQKKKAKEKEAETILLEDEKKIINIIKDLEKIGKTIRQKDIEKQVDFSKAKLSRKLRGLEERGLVKRTPYGNTNIVELTKKS